MYSSEGLHRLHLSLYFQFHQILLCLSKCRTNAFDLIHTLPTSSRRIWKTFRKCASLVTPPCLARQASHRLLLRNCNEDHGSFSEKFLHQMLRIPNPSFAFISRIPAESDLGVGSSVSDRWLREYCISDLNHYSHCRLGDFEQNCNEEAASSGLNFACNEINSKAAAFASLFPQYARLRNNNAAHTSHSSCGLASENNAPEEEAADMTNVAGLEMNMLKADASTVQSINECMMLRDTSADISHPCGCLIFEDNDDHAAATDLNFGGDEINRKADAFIARFREHIRLERRDSDLRYYERISKTVA